MKSRFTWIAIAAVAILAIATGAGLFDTSAPAPAATQNGASSAAQRTVTHAQGETAVPAQPERVVTYDIGALDTLDALGVPVLGVAGRIFPAYLQQYGESPYLNLGTLFEPNYEALNAARPDLIITGERSSAKYPQLSKLAPTVDMPGDDAQPLQVTLANARLLGDIFGKQAQVEELSAKLQQDAAALREKTANGGKGLIVLVTGGKMSAYGPGSRFGVLHTDFGVPAAAPDLTVSLHGEAVGSEFILKTNPDWLFVIDRDAAIGETGAAQQVLDNPLVRQTRAWQKGNVLYLDPSVWYLAGGGIQAMGRMISEVEQGYARAAQ